MHFIKDMQIIPTVLGYRKILLGKAVPVSGREEGGGGSCPRCIRGSGVLAELIHKNVEENPN
jgi:hypothetical protein